MDIGEKGLPREEKEFLQPRYARAKKKAIELNFLIC